jgi:hypothetical protein
VGTREGNLEDSWIKLTLNCGEAAYSSKKGQEGSEKIDELHSQHPEQVVSYLFYVLQSVRETDTSKNS